MHPEAPEDPISEEDYEAVIVPLFDPLAEADELIEKGDLKEAKKRLQLALDQLAAMERIFPVITSVDRDNFAAAADSVAQRVIVGARTNAVPKEPVPREEL